MPRTERTDKCKVYIESKDAYRCDRVIRLPAGEGEIEYRCARHDNHSGAHDSNVVHPHDGFLVRW